MERQHKAQSNTLACRSKIIFCILHQILNIMGFIISGIIGPWQIVLIVALVLLFFGGKKIPELMRGLGKGLREFKEGSKESNDEADNKKEND